MNRWKWLGLAGAVGIVATGAVVARKKRNWVEPDPDELRATLHRRLEEAEAAPEGTSAV